VPSIFSFKGPVHFLGVGHIRIVLVFVGAAVIVVAAVVVAAACRVPRGKVVFAY
jgi:hypothetical protein